MSFVGYVLEAFIGLDQSEFDKGLDEAGGKLQGFGKTIAGGIAGVGKTALAAGTAAVGAAVAGVSALTSSAVSAYGEYQQMAGGIETLYGDASDQMMEFAKNAYKTAGLSANEYMTTAIESSAAMINSLEGDVYKAAEMSDMAIRDMSDNVNKMGTTMESLQNAYRGFSRGNFTMLDNLSLGLSGTKEGMQQLLDKAQELSGVEYDIGSYADIVEAIHIVQESMGITGTTAAEAAGTITGSLGSVKAAWQNLVTGLADPDADLGALIDTVVQTGTAALSNLVPTITNALGGIGNAIEQIVPVIGEKLPELLESILPSLLSAAMSLVQSFSDALPTVMSILGEQIPTLLNQLIPVLMDSIVVISDTIVSMLPQIVQVISQNIGVIAGGIGKIISSIGKILVQSFPTIFPMVIQIGVDLLTQLANSFTENADEMISGLLTVVDVIVETLSDPETLMAVLQAGLTILTAVITGITNNLPMLLDTCGTLISNLATFLLEAVPELVVAIGENGATIITEALPQIILGIADAGAELLDKVTDVIAGWIPYVVDFAQTTFEGIGDGISNAWEWIKSKVGEISENVLSWFAEKFLKIADIGKDLVEGLWNGINDAKDWVLDKIKGFGDAILDGLKSFFGIASPSKKTAEFGRYLVEGLGVGFEDEAPDTFDDIQNALDKGMNSLDLAPLELDTFANVGVQSRQGGTNGAGSIEEQLGNLFKMIDVLLNQDAEIIIPVSIDGSQIDEVIVDSKRRLLVRSGGQVDV